MKLLEYQAKGLFDQCGIPTMRGCVVASGVSPADSIRFAGLNYPVVIKAQVQVGGRGKAGGIRFAETAAEAEAHCASLLGTLLKGHPVNALMIVEKATYEQEWYLSIMLDRLNKCPTVMFSAMGGMDIEQVAKDTPEKLFRLCIDCTVGVQEYDALYLLSSAGLDVKKYLKSFTALLKNLYRCFCANDCMLCEINPLVANADGTVLALDGKVDIDDSALFRLPEILAYREKMHENPLITEARAFNFLYIPVEQGGSIAVASNGSGMLMSCIDLISKEDMHVAAALDLGGGATAERIKEALRILFSTEGVKAVLINIFGGITRCDEVAGGIKLATQEGDFDGKLVIVRMEGTNKEQGLAIIDSLGSDIISVPGLEESVQALLERRDRL